MPEGYWGDAIDPEKDDFDLWLNIRPEDEQSGDDGVSPDEDIELEEACDTLANIIDDIGPAAALQEVATYLMEMERPFQRLAGVLNKLANRVARTIGAVEEARQTRGR